MTLLEEFKERVSIMETSFNLTRSQKPRNIYYCFMQNKIGKAKYIYGFKSVDEHSHWSIRTKYDLVAIISDGIIYVMDIFFFLSEQHGILPNGMRLFDDFVEELDKKTAAGIILSLFKDLPVDSDICLDENQIDRCKMRARREILNGKDSFEFLKPATLITSDEAARVLCGFDTVERIVTEDFTGNKKDWMVRKAMVIKINEFIQDKFSFATPCEIAIAESLRNIDEKPVVVEFEVGENIAAGKMYPGKLVERMITECRFNESDFITVEQGKEVAEQLEVGSKFNRFLIPEDITRIMFGKKILYRGNDYRENKEV